MRLSRSQSQSLASTVRKFHPLVVPDVPAGAGAVALGELGFAVRGAECVEWGMSVQRGYGKITLRLPLGRRTSGAHRWVREVQYGLSDLHALHLCSNKRCINLDHTYWGTPKQNADDRSRFKETSQVGDGHRSAKLNASLVDDIRARYGDGGVSQRDLAREYGVSVGTMSDAIKGKTWQH